MATDKVFFKSLDTLRFFAFLMVFNQHAFLPAIYISDPTNYFYKLIKLLCNGGLGVSFFFTLSGFLITYLIQQEIIKKDKIHVGFFYMRRALRIWPLYFTVIIFSLIIYPILSQMMGVTSYSGVYNKTMHFLFLSNFDVIHNMKFFPGKESTMVAITWSVSIEEQFYLVWPLLFRFISQRFFKFIFPVIILISLIFRFFCQDDYLVLYFHTLSVMSDLAIGGLGAYLVTYNKTFLEFIKKLKIIPIVLCYIAGFFLLLNDDILIHTPTVKVFTRIFETLFFIFIILEQNFSDHSIIKYSKWKILAGLGTITYGLYLLHPICQKAVDILFHFFPLKTSLFYQFMIKGILALCLSIFLCKLSYRYYESYFLKLKTRFTYIKTKQVD